jgi:hypothetical protein
VSEITSAVTAAPSVSQPVNAPPYGLSNWQKRIVLTLAIVFAALPFFFITDFELQGFHLNDLDASGFFFSLGLLPGSIAIVYQIVSATMRRRQGQEMLQQYYAFRNSRSGARPQEKVSAPTDASSTDPLGAVAAALFLTGIFLLIAVFAGYEASEQRGAAYNGVQGMMYAGLGSYVAVLYYMVARLYANALSSRFLVTSALRTASAVVIGWVVGIVGVTMLVGAPDSSNATQGLVSNSVIFMMGLFHNMAIDSLRRRAVKMFGATADVSEEAPLTMVEGIDDTTAELLAEHGIGSVQHLATTDPGVLCDGTLLPLDRILDWMDQALLMRSIRRNITFARGMGIRGAIDLTMIHMRDEEKLLASLADKVGMPVEALNHIALDLRSDYVVGLIYELQQGKPFPGALSAEPAEAPAAAETTQPASAAATATIPIMKEGATLPAQT